MNHSQKTEVLTNEDVAIERLCANTVALVTQTSHIKKLPLCPKNQEKTDIYFVC